MTLPPLRAGQHWQCRDQNTSYQFTSVIPATRVEPDEVPSWICDGNIYEWDAGLKLYASGLCSVRYGLAGNRQFYKPMWLTTNDLLYRQIQLVHLLYWAET